MMDGLIVEIEFGRVSKILKPDEEVVVVRVGDLRIVERLDLSRLLEAVPQQAGKKLIGLGLRLRGGREGCLKHFGYGLRPSW